MKNDMEHNPYSRKAIHDVVRIERRVIEKTTRTSRGVFRVILSVQRQALALSLAVLLVLSNAHGFLAFEAHVVNVTADLVQIDPPVISPPSASLITDPFDASIDDADTDAVNIYYTKLEGSLDPSFLADPVCGGVGGPKPQSPIAITGDTVIKAIACDTLNLHKSLVTTAIYDFLQPYGVIQGHKYHDVNQNGVYDIGIDFPIQGWGIILQGTSTPVSTLTDENGFYSFINLLPETYTITEEDRNGWSQTSPGSVTVVIDLNETDIADFFNFDTGFACVPKDINFPSRLAVQAAGSTTGNDDVALASNTTINGDVRSNDEIEIIGGGPNRVINGSATSTNGIDSGITITKMKFKFATSTQPLPDIMIDEWKDRAKDGGAVNGSFNFPNGTTGLVMGPSEILGNVTFGSSNEVTIAGPLYIHGDLTIGSNSTINEAASFGDQFATIIVDGEIEIDSNIAFNGSGSLGAFLLVSTHAAVSGSGAAIETDSNNSDLGDVVLYASNGDIYINSNRTLLALFAAHGTGADSDGNAAIRLDSNVTVNYRALPNKISCGVRQPFDSTAHILINEFMPNPSGSDTGSAGGALDGEWVELFNPTSGPIDVVGYVLYDNNNTHALPITLSNISATTTGTVIASNKRLVVYREGDADFSLETSGGDTVRLFNAAIGSGGILVDSHTYTVSAPSNKSFARIPDGSSNWIDPDATPGEPNLFFFEPLADASSDNEENAFEPAQKPMMDMAPREIPEEHSRSGAQSLPEQVAQNNSDKKIEEPQAADIPQNPTTSSGGDTPPDGDAVLNEQVDTSVTPTDATDLEQVEIAPAPEEAPTTTPDIINVENLQSADIQTAEQQQSSIVDELMEGSTDTFTE